MRNKILVMAPFFLLSGIVIATFASLIVGAESKLYWSGDHAIFMVDMFNASNFQQTIGISSRFGWAHPGPINYYLLLPWYWLSNSGEQGLILGTFFYNVIFLAGAAYVIALFVGRAVAAFFITATIAVIYVAMGSEAFIDVLLPFATLFPWVLALALACLVAVRGLKYVSLLVVVLTYVTQMHVAFWVPSAMLVFSSLGLSLYYCPPVRRDLAYILVATLLGLLLWLPPLLQEGNLRAIFGFFLSRPASEHSVWDAFRALTVLIGQPILGDHLNYRNVGSELPSMIVGMLLLIGVFVGAAFAWLRKQPFSLALAIILISQVLVYLYSLTKVTGPILHHSISFFSIISAFILLQLIVVFARPGEQSSRVLSVVSLAFIAVSAISFLPSFFSAVDEVKRPNLSVRDLYLKIQSEVGRCKKTPTIFMNQENWPLLIGAVSNLYRAGESFAIYPENWGIVFGGRVPVDVNDCQINISTDSDSAAVSKNDYSDTSIYEVRPILTADDLHFSPYGSADFNLNDLSVHSAELVDSGFVSQELLLPVGRYKIVAHFSWDINSSGSASNAAHFSLHGQRILSAFFTSDEKDSEVVHYIESDGLPFRLSFGLGGWSLGRGVMSMRSLQIYSIVNRK